jgi:serine phosphatase RsbU (regulator of sigma subunit)
MVFAKGKHGQRIPVEVTVAPVVNENGDVVGGIESFRDLSSLMDDLQHARSIQLNAMETDLAEDPRIQIAVHNIPYEYVSGDFYRAERLTDDSYVIFMADIMGHGVSSALYAMTIRSIWEEARGLLSNPSAFCTHLNEQLFNMTKRDDSFATAVFGVFDLSKMKYKFVRAGHPPPLLHRNGSVVPCGTPNQALGLFLDGEFIADEIDLQLGDRFLVYTDGAIEINNSDGEELGMDGLAKIILNEQKNSSGIEFIKKMETRILEYSNLMTFCDDLTLAEIVIKP